MATQTFHQFPMLPGEIRDQIWDLAVRPLGYRGVHIFIYIDEHAYDGHKPTSNAFPRHLAKKMCGDPHRFVGAPTPANETSPRSWTAGNPSTYAVDGGLLTACKESYMAMCRRYDIYKWSKYVDACPKVKDPIHYSYLQVWDIVTMPEWVIKDLLPFAPRLVGSSRVNHIALEFDTSLTIDGLQRYQHEWERDFEDNLVGVYPDYPHGLDKTTRWKYDGLATAMKSWRSSPDTRLWLVDRRLRLKHTALDATKSCWAYDEIDEIDEPSHERLIFEAEDSSYVGLPNICAWEFCEYEDQTNLTTRIWGFISELDEIAEQQLLMERNEHYQIGAHADFHTFGILVCKPKH
ncbi:hypothetical protein CGLO_05304 [Colletotrichum gloeosporioides Cg-14]|uniref:2EXR domain-containing protein n=1 Tax=Colletotrichum gloeosporioides (strain Cg-14) TaxID=1237896 RepID=T0KH47_COLGC|nr:hypothetical protein CGLO_05304 [Colletotrichum gloeosporioides Cg-14]